MEVSGSPRAIRLNFLRPRGQLERQTPCDFPSICQSAHIINRGASGPNVIRLAVACEDADGILRIELVIVSRLRVHHVAVDVPGAGEMQQAVGTGDGERRPSTD